MYQSRVMEIQQHLRSFRPALAAEEVCEVFMTEDNVLEIGFLSSRCRNDAAGTCIMCDYGYAEEVRDDDVYLAEMEQILKDYSAQFKCLLLCTNGSFFDTSQISSDLFRSILETAGRFCVEHVEFETHYQDVTAEKLKVIRNILPSAKITIEMGLETTNPQYQKTMIMKGIDLKQLESTIFLIQQYGFHVEINVMIGLPLLTPAEQLADALATVKWAIDRNCGVVLFPINIKPFTLLMHMYQSGYYDVTSHWLLLKALDTLSPVQLSQITIAWYGNRIEAYGSAEQRPILPTHCEICEKPIRQFYKSFLAVKSGMARKKLLEELTANIPCACVQVVNTQLNIQSENPFEERYTRYVNFLIQEFDAQKTLLNAGGNIQK